nr:MAG TPA: Putative tail protein [Caudoviricetes sp.]
MKNVSNEFKNIIKSGGPFYAYASITLKNGEKLVLDSENDFFISGNGYSEDGGNGFPLGSALSKSITLVIDNLDERYSNYDFYYAQISLHTEADVSSGTERLLEGTFTVLEPTAVGDTIELVGYDDMHKADIDFSSKLSYPTTAGQLLREVCNTCDISLGSPTFKNQDYSIKNAPKKVTCREVIGYIAQIAVGNAIIQNGTLTIKSYNFSPIANITKKADLKEGAGYCILENYPTDPDIGTDPVTITGIATTKKEKNKSTILLRGTEDYALEITNPLIEGNEEEALQLIGEVLIGSHMRSFSGEFFPDPTIEFMDLVCVVDRKEKVYPTFVTSNEFNYLGNSQLSCGIKDPERQKSTYYSEATKIYEQVKKDVQNTKTEFEEAVENLNKTLENASGMYATEVTQLDGSTITYIHDKPTVEESKNVIKITSEAIGISNDGGKTYPYGLFLTGDLITRILYTVGINADYINSGSIIVKDKNGNITFYADTETGRVVINAESVTITGKSVSEIAGKKADEKVDNFVNNVYKSDQESVQKQIDGKIDTYYFDYAPSNSNLPASEWTTASARQKHVGDLFFWKSKGFTYRYMKVDTSFQWVRVKDADIESAMQEAAKAQDTADAKRRVFTSTPTPPYDVGDLWTQGSTGDLMRCQTSRQTGYYRSSDWVLATKYTDDTIANKAIAQIEVLAGKIELKVTAGDVASIIEQKADSIRLKASEISWESTYSSMTESGILTCQRANINGIVTTVSGNRKAEMSSGATRYYLGDTELGNIGTNYLLSDANKKGLVFDLEHDGWYMSWSYKKNRNDKSYLMKMTYASANFDNYTGDAVNMGCNIDMHNWTLKNPSFEGGGITKTINYVQVLAVNSDGTLQTWGSNGRMGFKNGILIDLNYYEK